jgi:hypothetical protein
LQALYEVLCFGVGSDLQDPERRAAARPSARASRWAIDESPSLALTATLVGATTLADDNGFDLSGSLVPGDQIHGGGPVRDGIPSIDAPKFVPARDADFLDGEGRVLGVVRNGEARAYPIRIMNWHEIVNDRFGGMPVAVLFRRDPCSNIVARPF